MKPRHKTLQHELPVTGDVFNLAGEEGNDPFRLERESWEAAAKAEAARQYVERMQRTFEQCPGFIGGDLPSGPGGAGRVVVDPGRTLEAYAWLRKRFHVSENLELSMDNGLCIDIRTRSKKSTGSCRLRGPVFGKPVQFELRLETK